jgi:hypothetical protein
MGRENMKRHPSEPGQIVDENGQPLYTDLGHRGDFDFTQIRSLLAMTPTERLRHHESWRRFLKEIVPNAKLLRRGHKSAKPGEG